jgi:hypothetical protein
MLRHKPRFTYNGLTVIMSNGSRFDKRELLEGTGGHFFKEECLRPETNVWMSDVRLIDDKSPLLDGTKCVLLLGERAHRVMHNSATSLDEAHGNPTIIDGIPYISSFAPQDAVDPRDFESTHNPELAESDDEDTEEQAAGEVFASKGRAKTSRANFRFWLKHATKKCIAICNNNGSLPDSGYRPRYHIRPSSDEVIRLLTETKGQDFFYDMETDLYSIDMRCFAFSFGNNPEDVYIVPVLDLDYKPAYGGATWRIMRALAIAIRDNTIVAHNGSNFDFFVLAYKYQIPIGIRCFDTLIAQHRIYPTVEKSLGHCVAYYTYEPYHKNEGVHTYKTHDQMERLMLYCGKDVFTMFLVKKGQDALAAKDKGLDASIKLANRAIRPYLTTTLLGIKYDIDALKSRVNENDRLMMQYSRIISILTGPDVDPLISNKSCVKYFHTRLGYPSVAKTTKGAPSLRKDSIYSLALKHDNPVFKFLLKYREVQKETGTLNFKPWINI